MTPEQILNNYTTVIETEFGYTENKIIQMMKEYAHLMCEKQKIICADIIRYSDDYDGVPIDYESIIQCKNATEI